MTARSGLKTQIMAILNVTPDSFSDGGSYPTFDAAVDAGKKMWDQGADVVDVGGESTRPGAEPVDHDEELTRVIPVIEALTSFDIRVSIDTYHPQTAKAALDAGAWMINDVTGLRDPEMQKVVMEYLPAVCIMHMLGTPRTMQDSPQYEDVVQEVSDYLSLQAAWAIRAGIPADQVYVDPGIGFGKALEHNLTLLRRLDTIAAPGCPVVVGVSRKSFLGKLTGEPEPQRRLASSLAAEIFAAQHGASMLRVHDVSETIQGLRTWEALQQG